VAAVGYLLDAVYLRKCTVFF